MIPLDLSDLHCCIPMRNFVLTTSVMRADVVQLGDIDLQLDTSWNELHHQPIMQKVVRVPRRLLYGRRKTTYTNSNGTTLDAETPVINSMEWLTDIDIKQGDTVYVDSYSLFNASKEGRLFDVDGVKYYLIPYPDIYFRLDNGQPVMLNGWVGCEPIKDEERDVVKELKKLGVVFPSISLTNDNRRQQGSEDRLAIVRYIGLPVREYLDQNLEEHDAVSVGDTVILKWTANRRLEFDAGRFFGKTELIITRRPRIVGVMRDELFED